jgi:hypothetical protein
MTCHGQCGTNVVVVDRATGSTAVVGRTGSLAQTL